MLRSVWFLFGSCRLGRLGRRRRNSSETSTDSGLEKRRATPAFPYLLSCMGPAVWFLASSVSDVVVVTCSVMPNSLQPHGLQHARPPCPSLSPRACSCPLSQGCHPTISSSVIPFSHTQSFPSIRIFHNESAVHIRWLKYWNFRISPSNEYSGLISFRVD